MTRSGAVSSWVTRVHGLSKAEIDAHSGDDGYISIHTLVEEANAEYTMLLSSFGHWGPWGTDNLGAAPEAFFTHAELNTLVQKQVSTALTQSGSGENTK